MSATNARHSAAVARRIVVKIGSSILTEDGRVRDRAFTDIARQVAALREQKREVVIVSSGAIAIGSRDLGWSHPGRSIPEKQAAAAVGQIGLVELYRKRLARYGIMVGQVLVTRAGLEERERFINARRTLTELLRLGVVPIVNENDTVATDEIRFGDNDNLSATVVNLVAADLLVIATDVDGLYRETPVAGAPQPTLFDIVEKVTPDVKRAAGGAVSAFGRGGMATKLEAARAASACGAVTALCNGRTHNALLRVATGETLGTLFAADAEERRLASRKHWLAFTRRTRGRIGVDPGAARALVERGKSLLPAGISHVEGNFQVGDPVACIDTLGREVARGLVAYDADAIRRIAGLATRQIGQVLGYSNGSEVIHRNDLVLIEAPERARGERTRKRSR